MKKFLLIFIGLFITFGSVSQSYAGPPLILKNLILEWDRNSSDPEYGITIGYFVYRADNPEAFNEENFDYGKENTVNLTPNGIPQPETGDEIRYSLRDLMPTGHWFFVVTAYDDQGDESGPSNIVDQIYDGISPDPPQKLNKISVTVIIN